VREVFVAGTGMTRFGKFPEASFRSLAEEAVEGALRDAGATPGEVDAVVFANAAEGFLRGQEMIRGQVALRRTGLLGLPLVNVENACASGASALWLARALVASGAAEAALAVGAEQLTHPDKTRSFAALGAAVDLMWLRELGGARAGADSGGPKGHSPFMDLYAAWARSYMAASGATPEDFAAVAVKSHRNGARNPKAQYQKEVSLEEVLGSRTVAEPLTVLMCAPIGDGAAAVLLCSREWLERHDLPPVRLAALALVSGTERAAGEEEAVVRAARAAYEEAGLGPQDLDVVEVHDAAAPAELITYEQLGLCPPGGGPALLASGATDLGGRCPVNPSGGLLARGHPIGATGCAQVVELADQLRGRCGPRQVAEARVALAENGGGFLGTDAAAMAVTILVL
jgi:acetyl-CoA acyltransferase